MTQKENYAHAYGGNNPAGYCGCGATTLLPLSPPSHSCCLLQCNCTLALIMDPNYYNQYYQNQSQSSQNDINPYHQPYAGPSYPIAGSSNSSHSAPVPANAYEYDVGILAQQSVYVPGAMIDKRGGAGGKLAKGGKRTTVLRKGGGKVWEDQTLLEWNPCECFTCIDSIFFIHQLGSLVSSVRRRSQ